MNPERICVEAARPFWSHASQHVMGLDPADLPDSEAFQYWACGPICGVFHKAPWPGVWMAHHGCKPEGWGRARDYAVAGLRAFWDAERPDLILGWTPEAQRAAVAFAKRCGFVQTGVMRLPGGNVVTSEWRG